MRTPASPLLRLHLGRKTREKTGRGEGRLLSTELDLKVNKSCTLPFD